MLTSLPQAHCVSKTQCKSPLLSEVLLAPSRIHSPLAPKPSVPLFMTSVLCPGPGGLVILFLL